MNPEIKFEILEQYSTYDVEKMCDTYFDYTDNRPFFYGGTKIKGTSTPKSMTPAQRRKLQRRRAIHKANIRRK